MSHIKKYAPRRRFEKFSNADDWEQRKVSDYAINTYGGGTPKTNVPEYWSGEIPWIQSSDLLISNLFNVIPKKYITELAVKSSATKFIPANSIAIVSRVGVGKLVFMPFEYTTSQDFLSLSNLQVDSNFGVYSIYMMLQKELKNIQGTSIKGITKTDLLEKNINKPSSREEQQKIGAFFKQLDNTITLHQRKLEKIKALKTAYLSEMFPAEGETKPKRRFAGFTDDWEQCELGEESDVRDGTHDSPKYFDDGYPLVTSKNLKDFGLDLSDVSLISDKDFRSINKRSKVDIGDILFGMIGTIGNPVQIDRDDFAIKNVALIKEQKKILNSFLIQVLKSQVFNRYIRNENAGGTQKFLSLSKVRGFRFLCPNNEEQIRIGNFFKQIDETITLHQRKLQKLQNIKKAYLNEMFI
ncbi:restriction endonuclease subunit S [Listeria monocytogenes]|uniref:restriction endonuclease subunit S n=1 Tax=Listeria monocytogenes TaxID=1639 RepID=UPI0010B28C39|nr:restriction endonuclease subunit S [Listeria monocytogenes]EAC6873087.1 restriction endonuclease subunit S [Listeria monocytogenes]EAD1932176.1 restriction endonuclease subunit S [Listeria monocytogenes]